MKNRQSGFTLIELLVVIAIISLLSSVVLTQVTIAKNKGLDISRAQEIKQIQNALELYYARHGAYPISSGPNMNWASECDTAPVSKFPIQVLIDEGLISKIKDPYLNCDPTNEHWGYTYASDGKDYKLLAHTESSIPSLKNMIDPAQDGGSWTTYDVLDGQGTNPTPTIYNEHYGVWTPGAAKWVEMACNPTDSTVSQQCAHDPDGLYGPAPSQ